MNFDLIISDLRNSKDVFTDEFIISKYNHDNPNNSNNIITCYCSTGLLMKESNVNMSNWLSMMQIKDNPDLMDDTVEKLILRYDIDFTKKYNSIIMCPFNYNNIGIDHDKKEICWEVIGTFEHLLFHINDWHCKDFNEVADKLIEISKVYNLETGEKYN